MGVSASREPWEPPFPRRRESPIARINPSGRKVWVARWTDHTGRRRYGWRPDIPGAYELRRDAQAAIDACYERDAGTAPGSRTVGQYAASWTANRPRMRRTNLTNESRLRAVLDVKIEGRPLRDWPFDQLRRRHAAQLMDHLLTVQRRSATGATNIVATLSTMTEDAIEDDAAMSNPFRGRKVRSTDPRIVKQRRPVRTFSWQEMHEFARACASARSGGVELRAWRARHAEPMVRVLSDCGLRVGELMPLYVTDLDLRAGTLEVRWTESLGEVLAGTKTDHGEMDAGRVVPVPGGLCDLLREMLAGRPRAIVPPDEARSRRVRREALLFPGVRCGLWTYTNWWNAVWQAGRLESGMSIRPHECRHSYITWLRAAGIDDADLAEIAGHTVQTMLATYTHPLHRSHDLVRAAVGRDLPRHSSPGQASGRGQSRRGEE